jgi:hypothetical protein
MTDRVFTQAECLTAVRKLLDYGRPVRSSKNAVPQARQRLRKGAPNVPGKGTPVRLR